MLEQEALLLRPWSAAPDAPAASRTIVDPASGSPLGSARWQMSATHFWLRWLSSPVLEIREADDEPLLCTVQRLWSLRGAWEVRDADGRFVGRIRGAQLHDRLDRPLAVREHVPDNHSVRWRHIRGQLLASLASAAGGARLDFANPPADNPFTRMALLAAALVVER
jgi:hypothetical protein